MKRQNGNDARSANRGAKEKRNRRRKGLTVEALESRVMLATLQLYPMADNTLYEENTNSNGAGDYIFAGDATGTNSRRAVLKFDVPGYLPAGSAITGATLTMHMSGPNTSSENVSIHRLNANWGEGTSHAAGTEELGATPTTNDATWTHTFFSGTNWLTPGGDFNASPTGTIPVAGVGNYSWSTGNMLADINSWLTTPATNYGWIVIGNESTSNTYKRFNSKENSDSDSRPVLTITYDAPSNVDFADAPDTGVGTSTANYQTRIADQGPSHNIVSTIRMGAATDQESDGQPTNGAVGDDTNGLTPDDEDGLTNPAGDLALAEGQAPTVSVNVTNNTGQDATLYGWIDYDGDGDFELTERSSMVVSTGTTGQVVTLQMPTVPIGSFAALGGNATYARFRISTDTAAAQFPYGAADNGEVEDYGSVTISEIEGADFGDAPDAGAGNGAGDYNTLLADNGPRHAIINNLYLGVSVDGESDGQQSSDMSGDDTNGRDDEDGVVDTSDLVWIHGQQPRVDVTVTNQSGSNARLTGWLDYNNNGIFENNERALATVATGTTNGTVTLVFQTVPASHVGFAAARFRLSTNAAAAEIPTGLAPDGEVEDYQAYFSNVAVFDYGDAPDASVGTGTGNYNTTLADDGARHALQTAQPSIFLGANFDTETDGNQSSDATGDDTTATDDEDGISNPDTALALVIGQTPTVNVHAVNASGSAGFLYGWIDYDGDGVFETTEQASASVPNGTNGTVQLTFPQVPTGAATSTFARFRISTLEIAIKDRAIGGAPDGEVEDYAATITAAPIDRVGVYRGSSSTVYQDFNNDGSIDRTVSIGASGDQLRIGDVDGDGDDDLIIWRSSAHTFFIDTNSDGSIDTSFSLGVSTDVPVYGDWDGDNKLDTGVYRASNSTFYLVNDEDGSIDTTAKFGTSTDTIVIGDVNNDGSDDLGVYRSTNSTFYFDTDRNGTLNVSIQFGANGDTPLIGDWDGDGDDDIAVRRDSNGMFFGSTDGTSSINFSFGFGTTGDTVVQGDWDGDGDQDFGVRRGSTFYLNHNKDGVLNQTIPFGGSTDTSIVGHWPLALSAWSAPSGASASLVSDDQLAPIVSAAVDIWTVNGLTESQQSALQSLNIQVADLSGSQLAVAGGSTILIDDDAAGHGWFIDTTPTKHEEFRVIDESSYVALAASAAAGQMDLLTVLLHEIGHILGEDHDAHGLLNDRLDVGTRFLPS